MTETDDAGLREPQLFVVATVHLDTQWRWTVRDTIRRFLPRTLRENFSLFELFPDYVLSFEGAFRYMLTEEYFPQDFERLKTWVEAGRWRPAGNMIDSPDVNLASAESIIRHILYARRYFLDRFGTTSIDVFLPDCFGFPYSLPTLAAHCGLRGFSTSKMIKWIAPAKRPFDIGLWEGPDGARLIAVLDPGGYGESLTEDLSRSERWQRRLREAADSGGIPVGYRYFGVGDRGGSPDEASLYWLRRSLGASQPLQVVHAGSDELFCRLDEDDLERLPVHRGELLLPTHGTGCWTSQAILKRWNRRNELLAESAEKAAAIASWLAQFPYPTSQLRDDWVRLLWHQMHDDLTGTSIPEAYDITVNDEGLCLNRFAAVLTDALAAVARGLDTDTDGAALVVFNPLSCDRLDAIEAEVEFESEAPLAVEIVDPNGAVVPSQVTRRSGRTATVVFVAQIPPMSVNVFDVRGADVAGDTGDLAVGSQYLRNSALRVELDNHGDVARILSRSESREVLAAPMRLELLADRSPRWPAWEIQYAAICGPAQPVAGTAEIETLERGPARVALRVTRRAAGSTFRQILRLAAGQARLEVMNDVDWATHGRLLKVRFPLACRNDEASYDLGCGVVRRDNNSAESYEVPAHQWADLTDEGGEHGVSILSDSRYGWDKPQPNTLRLSLLRSPRTIRKFPHQATQDFGRHRFGFALYPHARDWRAAGTVLEAARFNQPVQVFQSMRHPGPGGRCLQFLETDQPRIQLRTLKRAEARAEWIVRLQESDGARGHVAIALGEGVGSGEEVDGCEETIGQAQVEGGKLHARLQSFQPRSFAVKISPPARRVQPLRTASLELPVDFDVASFHAEDAHVDFDGHGRSFPGELVPSEIMSGEVLFRLSRSPGGTPRALACRGQVLELPPDRFDSVFLLATAADDKQVETHFLVDERRYDLVVDSWSGPVATWWRRPTVFGRFFGRPRPPRLVRTPVAWLATHRHDRRTRDEPYTFCYLFRYELETGPEARQLVLPSDPRIAVFAATVAQTEGRRLRPAWPLYD